MKQKNKVGKPIDPRYKFFHYHAEKIIRDDPALKSSEVIAKIKSIRKRKLKEESFLSEKNFEIPLTKNGHAVQQYRIIRKYRNKISYINRMIPCLEKKIPQLERKLDEIILLLREMNK